MLTRRTMRFFGRRTPKTPNIELQNLEDGATPTRVSHKQPPWRLFVGDSGRCCTVFEVLELDVRRLGRTSAEEPHGAPREHFLLYCDIGSPALPQNSV